TGAGGVRVRALSPPENPGWGPAQLERLDGPGTILAVHLPGSLEGIQVEGVGTQAFAGGRQVGDRRMTREGPVSRALPGLDRPLEVAARPDACARGGPGPL